MSGLALTLPRVDREDVDVVIVDEWDVPSPTDQGSLADSIVDRWARPPRPDGLISVNIFTSLEEVVDARLLRGTESVPDGCSAPRWRVLAYVQWAGEQGRTVAEHELRGAGGPGDGEHSGTVEFTHYRSHHGREPRPNLAPGTGCDVFVTVAFERADRQRQHAWIDAVLAALAAEPEPAPGLLAAHFHTSNDGTRVLNYAEWTSAQAHRDALEGGDGGIGTTDLPEWRAVRQFPGIRANTVGRYALHRSLEAGTTTK